MEQLAVFLLTQAELSWGRGPSTPFTDSQANRKLRSGWQVDT